MRWINELTNVIKVPTIIIGLILLIAVNIGMNYLILGPYDDTVQKSKLRTNQLTETVLQLKAAKINSLIEFYNAEVEYLSKKETELFSHPLAIEQIPLFMSRLEREATKAGLSVNSSRDKYKNSEEFKTVSLTLKIQGSFQQILNFLRLLESWDEVLLISDFSLKKRGDAKLSGHLKLISVVK